MKEEESICLFLSAEENVLISHSLWVYSFMGALATESRVDVAPTRSLSTGKNKSSVEFLKESPR